MRFFRCTSANLIVLYFVSTVLSKPLIDYFNDCRAFTKSLWTRQVTGVVGTPQFLRRAYQTSTVVDNWIYIDGGEFSFLNNGTPVYTYSNTILAIDLSRNWTNASVSIHSTSKPAGCISLNAPSLWYHQPEDVLYSGFAGWQSSFSNEDIDLNNISIWTFEPDRTGSGAWKNVIPFGSTALSSINRPEQGFQAFGNDSAWVLGGFDKYDPGQYPYLPSMVQFNMSSRTFTNISAPAYLAASGAVDNGAMHYVPSFGTQGLFVAMGGDTIQSNPGLIGFDTVAVFDPEKQQWFNQTTTGSPPTPRLEFCTAGLPSDNETYEIFVYAGWGTKLGAPSVQYDTISILTLPAFHWISVPNEPQSPRIGLTCNAVGGSQVLTIGGRDGNPPGTYGTHIEAQEASYASPDPNAQGLAIFDMTNLTWSTQYTAAAPPYLQSNVVKQFYSGAQRTYSQNLTAGVAALLQVTHFPNTTTPSSTSSTPPAANTAIPSPHSSHSTTGGIIGGAVGGTFMIALVAFAIFFLIKKRRRANERNVDPADGLTDGFQTTLKYEEPTLQEMDQDSGRPIELGANPLCEAEERQISELESWKPGQDHGRPAELGDSRDRAETHFGIEERRQ